VPEPGEVVLAFDYGSRRIGVAVGQTTTGSAGPAGVVPVGSSPDWAALERCVREWSPARLLVGLPYNMDGSDTVLTATCRAFGDELAQQRRDVLQPFGRHAHCLRRRPRHRPRCAVHAGQAQHYGGGGNGDFHQLNISTHVQQPTHGRTAFYVL